MSSAAQFSLGVRAAVLSVLLLARLVHGMTAHMELTAHSHVQPLGPPVFIAGVMKVGSES